MKLSLHYSYSYYVGSCRFLLQSLVTSNDDSCHRYNRCHCHVYIHCSYISSIIQCTDRRFLCRFYLQVHLHMHKSISPNQSCHWVWIWATCAQSELHENCMIFMKSQSLNKSNLRFEFIWFGLKAKYSRASTVNRTQCLPIVSWALYQWAIVASELMILIYNSSFRV